MPTISVVQIVWCLFRGWEFDYLTISSQLVEAEDRFAKDLLPTSMPVDSS